MLRWLFPRPPIDVVEKAWVETRMQFLAEQLGIDRLLAAQVLVPTREFYAEAGDGSPEAARRMMERLCDHMTVDSRRLDLEVCDDDQMRDCVGLYEPGVIRVAQRQLADPEALTATIAHELAHSLLPPETFAQRDERESEWLTDLLPVFLGLGVFIANAVLRESSFHDGIRDWWSMRRQGYLPARMTGYAMALFALIRGDRRPPWKAHLRLDALSAFSGGMQYLQRTSDTLFTPETALRKRREPSTAELIERLVGGSATARVAALWELHDPRHASASRSVMRCLTDRLPGVRVEAARTLACYGEQAGEAIPLLVDLLDDVNYPVRCAAATTLGTLGCESELVLPQLSQLLRDPDRAVVMSAALAVKNYGDLASSVVPGVLSALKTAMIRCDHPLIDALTHALFALDPDPTDRVMDYFGDDLELRQQVVHLMVDALKTHDPDPPA